MDHYCGIMDPTVGMMAIQSAMAHYLWCHDKVPILSGERRDKGRATPNQPRTCHAKCHILVCLCVMSVSRQLLAAMGSVACPCECAHGASKKCACILAPFHVGLAPL
ncbi:hypothetical protein HAX54_017549 [Datura stramonium]|uniref:Uncharacterized protein n=1 Tax=Datura stramonium TaxID=4076 RepID=A0ABS8UMY9_DATST|nr:hypothetical protein [Datura stramonium]